MDSVDRDLISLLGENARASTSALARKLGLSRTTVQSRIERLERQGIITGYAVRLSEGHEAALVRAYVMLTIEPKATRAVASALRRIPEVRTLHTVSGVYDMVAVVAAATVREMDGLLDRIGEVDGVERTTSSIILGAKVDR
jgi:DNA-binding Lrp family transcriptional regulator